jgi:hypothetical protein
MGRDRRVSASYPGACGVACDPLDTPSRIHSEQDLEFVACMEEVLEIYAKAFDPKHSVLCMAQLLGTRYADCERVTLVLDNLNTHTKGAFYVVLAPDGACLLEYGSNSVTRRSTAVG